MKNNFFLRQNKSGKQKIFTCRYSDLITDETPVLGKLAIFRHIVNRNKFSPR